MMKISLRCNEVHNNNNKYNLSSSYRELDAVPELVPVDSHPALALC